MAKSTKKQSAKSNFLKPSQKVMKSVGNNVGSYFDLHVVERFSKLKHVRRPVVTWLFLILVLTLSVFIQTRQLRNFYIDEVPVSGGVLKEGIVGEVSNVNPLYTSNSADSSLSRLIFSSLLKYNDKGEIEHDLARKMSVNDAGTVYKFTIRDNAMWQDGQPVTADDIVFTFDMLQHPDSGSPLLKSWRGVKVKNEGNSVVSFSLPNAFAPFPNSLVGIGILPKHILGDVDPSQLRGHRFNLANPIGSGPFQLVESIVVNGNTNGRGIIRFKLIAHDEYHFGKPRLNSLHLFIYGDREEMISDFNDGELALVGGLVASDIPDNTTIEVLEDTSIDESLIENRLIQLTSKSANIKSVPRTSQVMLFLQNGDPILKNVKTRQAISYAIDRQKILQIADSYYTSSRNPLLSTHLGYSDKYLLPQLDQNKAEKLLDEVGWKKGSDGFRYNSKKTKFTLTIISQADDIFPEVLASIQSDLKEVGIEIEAVIVSSDRIQQDFLAEHSYQAILYGINIGHDPDQFAFWHSSQTGLNGRNLSGYSSSVADSALEAGRTRIDETLRTVKYKAFQQRWVADTPAVALYQPSYIYTYKKQVSGIDFDVISDAADRYHNVYKWTVNVDKAQKLY